MTFEKGNVPWNKGKPHGLKTKQKIKDSWDYNKYITPERNLKISIAKKGKKRPDLTKRNLEDNNVWKDGVKNKISKTVSDIWKQENSPYRTEEKTDKQRESYINHIIKYKGNYQPNIGKQEKEILDFIEPSLGFPIIRQYKIRGYFVDGYSPERNIVFEVDERPKINERDINREKIIRQEFNCSFIRIPLWK